MPVFVDPNTGERYDNVPEDEVERAEREFGLVTPEQYAAQKAYDDKGVIGKAGDIATAGLQGAARASMAPGMALQYAITGDKQALESPRHPDSAFEESVFSPEAMLRKERHGLTAGVGEAVPSMLAGGATGGLTVGPLAGAGLLAGESALQGLSQEAVDSVTQKRDFSGKAALMNGGVDLALSALTFGLARGLGKGAPGLPGERNLIAELDPGEVPEAIGGTRRRARSAGSAGAANAPYRAPKPASAADEVAEAANDVEPFADDMWEGAQKAWKEGEITATPEDARFLADEGNRKALTDLAAMNSADNLDIARRVMRDDAGLAAKNADIQKFAKEWTPEQVAAKRQWVDDVGKQAEGLLSHIDQTRRAAADVTAGRAGARVGGAGAVEAGGLDNAIQKSLRQGLDRVRRADGAEQAIALDGLKRNIGGLVGDIRMSRTIDEATKKERTQLLTDFYGSLQKGLESEQLFGRMGTLQKATNEAVTRVIEPWKRVEARLSEKLDDTWGAVGQQAINRQTVAAKMGELIKGDPLAQRELLRDLSEGIAAYDDLIAARQAHGITAVDDLEIAKRAFQEVKNDVQMGRVLGVAEAKAAQYKPGIGEMLKDAALSTVTGRIPVVGGAANKVGREALERFSKAAELPRSGPLGAALDNRLKAYSRIMDLQDPGISQRLPSWLQGALRGKGGQVASVGGIVGAGALLAPGEAGAAEMLPEQRAARDALEAQLQGQPPEAIERQVRTAEAFARIGQQVDRRVKGAVETLFRTATDPETPAYRSPQARALDQRAAELDVPRHLARFMGKADDPTEAFRGKAKLITELASDPAKLSRHMAENLGELPRDQPEMFAGMVAQTMAAVSYLYDKMPGNAGRSVLDPKGYPPTFEEISEWAAHWTGAFHPLDSLDDLASNELQPEQMEAVQGLWPEGYQMFQTAAMSHIHQLSRKKGGIPMDALEQIDAALGLDGAGEPLLSKGMADLLRQAEAQDQEQRQAEGQRQAPPMQSQSPQRLASSALGSLHGEP